MPTSLTYADLENLLSTTYTTKPTPTQVTATISDAWDILVAKVGSVDDTKASEKVIVLLIAVQLMAIGKWSDQGYSSQISTPAGSMSMSIPPYVFTSTIKGMILNQYGIDLDQRPATPFYYYNPLGATSDR